MKEVIYLRPKKAARKLKSAQGVNQTVYIYGVTGTGKTSLVKDYLGRRAFEYYTPLSVFSGGYLVKIIKNRGLLLLTTFTR